MKKLLFYFWKVLLNTDQGLLKMLLLALLTHLLTIQLLWDPKLQLISHSQLFNQMYLQEIHHGLDTTGDLKLHKDNKEHLSNNNNNSNNNNSNSSKSLIIMIEWREQKEKINLTLNQFIVKEVKLNLKETKLNLREMKFNLKEMKFNLKEA